MADKEYQLIPLFERFISGSYKGRRLKSNGNKIRPQTVDNYVYVLRYLQEYELLCDSKLRIRIFTGAGKRNMIAEKNYWKKFYLNFTNFLYTEKDCYDNYVGTVIKTIRIFFNYLNRELSINTGLFYKNFYICKEEIPIIALQPEQLQFLINDKNFETNLGRPLQKSKDIFVFGCTVALRISDLFAVTFNDIELLGDNSYLSVKTIKTNTTIRIKLPDYAIAIIKKFKEDAKGRRTIFPPIPVTRFNNHLKEIAFRAGWTNDLGKKRSKRGVLIETFITDKKKQYRFCDLISSHTMRRTAITTMLMLGMKEHLVKKISGHSDNSKSFYRYVNLVQSYLDNETDAVFNKLAVVA